MSTQWVERFADLVPAYTPIAPVHPQGLPGWGLRPSIRRFSFDDEVTESLTWESGDGETSQSPASQHVGTSTDPARAVLTLAETLELPGEPDDYHFAIQQTVEELRRNADVDPTTLNLVEHLCWYDIHLAYAAPDALSVVRDGERQWYRMTTVSTLVRLYEREGALREAAQVATIASEAFDQMHDKAAALSEKLATVEAETA